MGSTNAEFVLGGTVVLLGSYLNTQPELDDIRSSKEIHHALVCDSYVLELVTEAYRLHKTCCLSD